MNTSQFMDKQIMDLSSSSSPPSTDFIDLNNNTDDHQKQPNGFESNKEEILPSYDFQPIRPNSTVGLSHAALDLAGSTTSTAARVWSAADSKPLSTSSNRGFGSLDFTEPGNLVTEKPQNMLNTTVMSEIDRTMKKYVDNLLHVMEGVSARLSQLETRTHNLEDLIDDLKVSVDSGHGRTDGKMRKLENILLEVQSGVLLLKDKQEIFEAQLQLSKHQVSKAEQHPKAQSLHLDPTAQPPTQAPMQHMPQLPANSFLQPPSSAAAPSPKILQPPSSQQLAQLPSQIFPHHDPYYPPPSHSQPSPPNHSPYQAPPQTQTLQTPHQPPYQSLHQQPPLSSGYNPQEQPPFPMQSSYTPNPSHRQPPIGSAPSQPQPSLYDGAGGRSNPGFSSGYLSEPYPYTSPPMASAKPPHMSGSGTGYPQLSNSRPLPNASAVNSSGSSGSPRSEGRVPIDDVIDRVTTMGFSRDQVRATVRKLTDNGQAVDLNVVLDKLMNDGGR